MASEVKNIVTTDMRTIHQFRKVHDTEEENAYIVNEKEKVREREATNRRGEISVENDRSFNKKVLTKKEMLIVKEKEKVKEFKDTQEKLLEPPVEKKIYEEEDEVDEENEKPVIDPEEWKRRVMEDIVESFNLIDINGDGKISVYELMSIMGAVGEELTHEDVEDIFEVVDLDGDGVIGFEEFKECMFEKLNQETMEEDLVGAFKCFDEDGDGFISPTELQHLFKQLGEMVSTDEAVELMQECDLNKDGVIDFEEFKAFYFKVFENKPTLAQELEFQQQAREEQIIAEYEEQKLLAEYPPSEVPYPGDYK